MSDLIQRYSNLSTEMRIAIENLKKYFDPLTDEGKALNSLAQPDNVYSRIARLDFFKGNEKFFKEKYEQSKTSSASGNYSLLRMTLGRDARFFDQVSFQEVKNVLLQKLQDFAAEKEFVEQVIKSMKENLDTANSKFEELQSVHDELMSNAQINFGKQQMNIKQLEAEIDRLKTISENKGNVSVATDNRNIKLFEEELSKARQQLQESEADKKRQAANFEALKAELESVREQSNSTQSECKARKAELLSQQQKNKDQLQQLGEMKAVLVVTQEENKRLVERNEELADANDALSKDLKQANTAKAKRMSSNDQKNSELNAANAKLRRQNQALVIENGRLNARLRAAAAGGGAAPPPPPPSRRAPPPVIQYVSTSGPLHNISVQDRSLMAWQLRRKHEKQRAQSIEDAKQKMESVRLFQNSVVKNNLDIAIRKLQTTDHTLPSENRGEYQRLQRIKESYTNYLRA